MSVEPIGIFTAVVGFLCLALGYRASAVAVVIATLLGSAAALLVGSANIQPAHLLLGFLALAVMTRRHQARTAARALSPGRPGFWLACLVVYGLVSGQLLPRLLAGATQIVPVGTSELYGTTDGTVPLGPVSGNVTQSIYLLADLACFAMISGVASTGRGFYMLADALVAYAAANVAFALLDIATFATGTASLLDFMRNAQYAFHLDEEVAGLKRIAGSFTEASSFAHATLGALGFVGTMWVCGRRSAWTGPLALASLALIVLSTSSTGLVGMPPMLVILYVTALRRCGLEPRGRNGAYAIIGVPVLVIVAGLALALDAPAWTAIHDYFTGLVFEKSGTQSGIERAAWNASAWRNFVDSSGLGVGLGTARASSFALAVLSNVGVLGTLTYGLFAWTTFAAPRGIHGTFASDVRLSARNASLGLLIGDVVSGALVDQGLIFYVLAAVACAIPDEEDRESPQRVVGKRIAA